jgi:uncharacterized protein (DUF4415 family)
MIFTIFRKHLFVLKPDMEEPKNELSPLFEPAAAPPPPERVTVTLDLDADVVEWFKAQPTGLQRELNNLARFFMETSLIREANFKEAAGPENELETAGPDPACEPAPKWDPACHAYNFLILLMKMAVEGGPDRRRSGPHPKGESISDNKALWRLSSGVPLRC